MLKGINNKVMWIKENYNKGLFVLLIIALSIVETGILNDINNSVKVYFKNIELYIVAIPILLILIINWTSDRVMLKLKKIDYQNNLKYMRYSFFLTIFLYLICVLINFNISNRNIKIEIILICFTVIFLTCTIMKFKVDSGEDKNLKFEYENSNKLFNTYYINISKVFEIAMLINNKIAVSVQKERTIEDSQSVKENLNANINLEYLKVVKNGITYDDTYTKTNSEKNRVLENFDVKTTKSNLLDTIIKKCKEYKANCEIYPGDLLLFNNVKIELMNQEETMQTTKILLNGAFNGSNFSSTSDEMKMDLNMSSLTNSILKDCSYELKCTSDDLIFYIKIPMSFENDFENSYNIYDLLIGKMTLIGVYRGKDNKQKYKSAFDYFNSNQNKSNESQISGSGLSRSVNIELSSNNEVAMSYEPNSRISNYIDVIAVIQEINIDMKNSGVKNE